MERGHRASVIAADPRTSCHSRAIKLYHGANECLARKLEGAFPRDLGCALRLRITFSPHILVCHICSELILAVQLESIPRGDHLPTQMAMCACNDGTFGQSGGLMILIILCHAAAEGRALFLKCQICSLWQKSIQKLRVSSHTPPIYEPISHGRKCLHQYAADQLTEIQMDSPTLTWIRDSQILLAIKKTRFQGGWDWGSKES